MVTTGDRTAGSDTARAIELLDRAGAIRRSDSGVWIHEGEPEAQAEAERALAAEIGAERASDAIRDAIADMSVETPPQPR